ncbi:transmembrane protein 17-like [Thrips palmi]|uniref:Transmembrane protein 17-like n=1 Tax=Thrips palmi TaxID=161013 RepID=A0A6P8Z8K9_THRPL|nr:transmembrane protein 17-like [Thrips palmi]
MEKVSRGLSLHHNREHRDFISLGHEITSCLPLQMSLYFNVIFFPFWIATTLTMLSFKYEYLSTIYKFILILILVCLIIIECVRLYLGYLGNLSEKVPELAGFWVLSIVLQLPLHLLLLFSPPLWPLPAETAVEIVMLVLLLTQLGSGFFALRKSALHQARRYHLAQIQNKSTLEDTSMK